MKKLLSVVLCLTMILSLFAGSAFAAEGEKNLIYSINRAYTDLSPVGGRSATMNYLLPMLYNFLFVAPTYGTKAEDLQGEIAKSYEMIDDLTCQVKLYDYVKDSEGNPIKAEDVAFSYELLASAPTGLILSNVFESAEVVDDYTLNLHMHSNYVGELELLLTITPIISKTWWENASEEERSMKPITPGSYKVVESVPGSYIQFTKNENYWQTDPELVSATSKQPFDNVRFNIILESSMAVIGLQNHEADIARDISVVNLDKFSEDEWEIFANLPGMNYWLAFNNMNGVFADNKALRQAVLYAFNSADLMTAFAGASPNYVTGEVCKSFGSAAFAGYLDKWRDEDYYEYNPEKAKELLAEAGYPDGVTVKLLYDGTAAKEAAMTVFKIELAEVGINVELMPAIGAEQDALAIDPTAWDMYCCQQSSSAPFMASYWKYMLHPAGYANGSMCFTHDDVLTEKLEAVCNVETYSDETLDDFHQYLKEQAYIYGLYYVYE